MSKRNASSESLIGKVFGRLTVMECTEKKRHYRCICQCGKVTVVYKSHLTSGDTQSCGCLKRERTSQSRRIHGHHGGHAYKTRTKTYNSWYSMKDRCCYPKNIGYALYGGAGVTVCDRWRHSFVAFLEDMGERPEGCTLDRIDNSKGYEPGNCRWATRKEQGRNKRNNVMLTHDGRTQPVSAWAEELGINYGTLMSRLFRYKWSVGKALTTPVLQISRPTPPAPAPTP